ncbi:MAG: helix-turn-helix domain-containing protein [Planctomycetota bacterium]|nr:helix-turn-helix domain-containing protein [Planctomycetota bacterium]
MDLFAVPELAVQNFERLHGLRVTVHDLAGNLWPYLSPERFQHVHPLCQAVKVFHPKRCIDFGITQMRRQLPNQPDGRVQVCFAGLVEWVVPVFRRGGLMWVIFAGPRLAADDLRQAVRDPQPPPDRRVWPKGTPMPPKVGDEDAQVVLEALRQLAARLERWHAEREQSGTKAPERPPVRRDGFVDDFATRRAAIQRFVQMRHTAPVRLADLAEQLNLSESRAAHAVKEVCGKTFVEMLTEARLRTASGLLRHTNLDILDVALRSGFGDVSHFHRCFRTRFKSTPLKYRKQAEAPAP